MEEYEWYSSKPPSSDLRRWWRNSRRNGVTHVVTIPDSETNYLYELMEVQDWLDVVPVSREGEAWGTALGLNIAGKVPVVLVQNTGMLEAGDSIRGMAIDAGFPLVMIIGYRGWNRRGVITDSVAKYTEPFLTAFGINYYLVEQNEDGDRISVAFEEAQGHQTSPWPSWSATNTTASTGSA